MLLLLVASAFAASPTQYHYKGPKDVCFCDVQRIVADIQADPTGDHMVWIEGWSSWKSWKDVPDLVAAVGGQTTLPAETPPPAPTATREELAPAPPRTDEPPRPAPGPRREDGPRLDGGAPPPGPIDPHAGDLHLGHFVTVGADARAELAWDDMQDEDSIATFRLRWLKPHVDATLADWADANATLSLRSAPVDLAEGEEEDVTEYEGAPVDLSVDEAWLEVHGRLVGSLRQRFRIGVQAPLLGTVDHYEHTYFFGGTEAWEPLELRAGLVPYRDIGFTYAIGGEAWEVAGQATNGGATLDTNGGKDFSGRITVHGGQYVDVSASALYGARAANSQASVLVGVLAIEPHYKWIHADLEAIFGRDSEHDTLTNPVGFSVVPGVALPLKGVVRTVDLDAYYHWYDPSFADTDGLVDRWWAYGGALGVHWAVLPKNDFYTTLTVEQYTPEDLALPVSTNAALTWGWSF